MKFERPAGDGGRQFVVGVHRLLQQRDIDANGIVERRLGGDSKRAG